MSSTPLVVPDRYLLAGHMRPFKEEDLQTRYEHLFEDAKTSAKGVHIAREPLLPWEHDTHGKWFSTDGEQLDSEIRWIQHQIEVWKAVMEGELLLLLLLLLLPAARAVRLIICQH